MVGAFLKRLLRWRLGRLSLGTAVVTAGMVGRAVMQAVVFFIIARTLQPGNYGALCAVLAIASAIGSFGGLGTSMLIVCDTSRDASSFTKVWGSYLAVWGMSTPLLFVVFIVVSICVLPPSIPVPVIILLGLSDVCLAPLSAGCSQAFQAWERMTEYSRLVVMPVVFRFVAAVLFLSMAFDESNRIYVWAVLYALAAFSSTIYSVIAVLRRLDVPVWPKMDCLGQMVRKGMPFAIGGSALRLYSDIDKTMLSRIVSLDITGVYSAAYRIMDMAVLPVSALNSTILPQLFKVGATGPVAGLHYLWRILPLPLGYALLAGAFLYFGADFFPSLLGENYQETIVVLQSLAWLPLLTTPRYLLQTVLGASGKQSPAVLMICIGAFINIVMNACLIPAFGWKGAVIATYFAEGIMIIGFIIIVFTCGLFSTADNEDHSE